MEDWPHRREERHGRRGIQALSNQSPLSLVVLIAGSGSNLQAIIDAIEQGELNARIRAVISNRPDALGLQRAQQHGIEAIALDHTQFDCRANFDARLQQEIDALRPDLIVLAGYMRILTEGFIEHFAPNMLNIHPSLLPKYQGLNTHQRALDNGDDLHGISIHVVTPELDSGPVILQGHFAIETGDDKMIRRSMRRLTSLPLSAYDQARLDAMKALKAERAGDLERARALLTGLTDNPNPAISTLARKTVIFRRLPRIAMTRTLASPT